MIERDARVDDHAPLIYSEVLDPDLGHAQKDEILKAGSDE